MLKRYIFPREMILDISDGNIIIIITFTDLTLFPVVSGCEGPAPEPLVAGGAEHDAGGGPRLRTTRPQHHRQQRGRRQHHAHLASAQEDKRTDQRWVN